MNNLKPIQTVYNGYKFRSRLEARWAVFFDALGVEYQYEPEGFDLDGIYYLPDFWLPKMGFWFEVKPDAKSADVQIDCFKKFSKQSECPLFVSVCSPEPRAPSVALKPDGVLFSRDHASKQVLFPGFFIWEEIFRVLCLDLFVPVDGKTSSSNREVWGQGQWRKLSKNMDLKDRCVSGDEINDAFKKAKQARFEHGENRFASLGMRHEVIVKVNL